MPSNAVSSSAVATVVGYLLGKYNANSSSPNLPQNINILAEANDANQSGLSSLGLQITSATQAGNTYGFGSPIYQIARILFPSTGGGVKIPVWVYAQPAAGGAAAKVITITPSATATIAKTIYLNIAGRETLDGGSYAVNIAVGDTVTQQCDKMRATIAAVLGCPVLGSGTTTFISTTKWKGLTANDVTISVDLGTTATDVTYAVVNTTAGSGTPSTTGSGNGTTLFGNQWKTIVINSYGFVSTVVTELEAFNGIPDPVTPTGRFTGTIMKPIWALTGTTLDDPTSITGAAGRNNQVTLVPCVAPLSLGMPFEAAANVAFHLASVFQDNPQNDVIDAVYPDMPGPAAGNIPAMNSYTFRQTCVLAGCSTVDYNGAYYKIKDLVTTYNLAGEYPPFYRWVRDLNVHFNYKFAYHLKEAQEVYGKTISADGAVVTAANVIKPKMWAASVAALNKDCEKRGLLVNVDVNNKTISVAINGSNSNRLDTVQDVQISGVARVCATTTLSGFYFGN